MQFGLVILKLKLQLHRLDPARDVDGIRPLLTITIRFILSTTNPTHFTLFIQIPHNLPPPPRIVLDLKRSQTTFSKNRVLINFFN